MVVKKVESMCILIDFENRFEETTFIALKIIYQGEIKTCSLYVLKFSLFSKNFSVFSLNYILCVPRNHNVKTHK